MINNYLSEFAQDNIVCVSSSLTARELQSVMSSANSASIRAADQKQLSNTLAFQPVHKETEHAAKKMCQSLPNKLQSAAERKNSRSTQDDLADAQSPAFCQKFLNWTIERMIGRQTQLVNIPPP